ncbi:MAG TPA: NAD(P)/FAD-dependent oxidoreductase [Aggregatilineales bacterium]|jgi:thioredoxin reductase (NADPH)|nr:NAD(P)/FAD-dependent oxidoreductase [Aggregatilineales bacterium]
MPEDVFDITILGAGPTGLFASFYAGLREMKTKIIEALPEPGGQLAVLYPEKFIYDVPGYPRILAKDLVRNLVEQADTWLPTYVYSERAQGLVRRDDAIIELATDRATHYTRTVVICAGIGAFRPNRLDLDSLNRFEGNGVYYFVQEKRPFHRKKLLVVGGGDSAVDWALNLKDYADSVTLIHRREGFRAHPSSVTELMNSNVDVRLWYELKEVHGNDHITGATIFDNRTGEETTLDIDIVLLNLGFKADLGAIRDWGLEFEKRYILVNERQETNIPGVYAAGDIARQNGTEPLSLIATGFGQAAVAVNYAYSYITGGRVFPGHSSEMRL